jgi:hypothetical protein
MTADRYQLLQLQKGATIHECQDCGTVTFHRAIHDAWHEVTDRESVAIAVLIARLCQAAGPETFGPPCSGTDNDALAAAISALGLTPDYRTN